MSVYGYYFCVVYLRFIDGRDSAFVYQLGGIVLVFSDIYSAPVLEGIISSRRDTLGLEYSFSFSLIGGSSTSFGLYHPIPFFAVIAFVVAYRLNCCI